MLDPHAPRNPARRRAMIIAGVAILGLGALFLLLQGQGGRVEPGPKTFELDLVGGQPSGTGAPTWRAAEGDEVTIRVTSDETVDLHLHGYDMVLEVPAGQTREFVFEARLVGSFEFEVEGAHELVARLEVRPR